MGKKNKKKVKASALNPPNIKVRSKSPKSRQKSKTKTPMKSKPVKKSKSKTPAKKFAKINLQPEQIPQVKNLIEILKRNICAFDMSMMGAGKTYVSSEVAIRFGFKKVIVVCPASVVGKWREMKEKYGLNLEDVISYEGLRSTQDHQPTRTSRNFMRGIDLRRSAQRTDA